MAFQELIVALAVQIDRRYYCAAGIIGSLRSVLSVTIYSFEVTIIIKEDSILSQKIISRKKTRDLFPIYYLVGFWLKRIIDDIELIL